MSNDFRQEDGFTIVETIVAFAVLSLALMTLAQAISQATLQVKKADVLEEGQSLAKRLLVIAQGSKHDMEGEGAESSSHLVWKWTKTIFPRQDSRFSLASAVLTTVEIRNEDSSSPLFILKSVDYVEEKQ